MTDKAKKRAVALPRLHKSVDEFAKANNVAPDATVQALLDTIQAAWFKEAKQ